MPHATRFPLPALAAAGALVFGVAACNGLSDGGGVQDAGPVAPDMAPGADGAAGNVPPESDAATGGTTPVADGAVVDVGAPVDGPSVEVGPGTDGGSGDLGTGADAAPPPAECEGLVVADPEPSVTLDGLEFSYDRIGLADDRTTVSSVNLLYTNTSDEEKEPRYNLKYSLRDLGGQQVDVMDWAGFIGEFNFIGRAIHAQAVSFGEALPAGKYVLVTDLCDPDTNVKLATLEKQICLAPGGAAEVAPVRPVVELPLAEAVVVDDLEFRFDRVALTESRDGVESVNLEPFVKTDRPTRAPQ